MVQVVVGQQRGAGVRMGSRCLWDSITDNKASETLVNVRSCPAAASLRLLPALQHTASRWPTQDNLFAVATAYGVYLY